MDVRLGPRRIAPRGCGHPVPRAALLALLALAPLARPAVPLAAPPGACCAPRGPQRSGGGAAPASDRPGDLALSPTVEWVHHRTADGAHPDGREQTLLWLLNRARADPAREGARLAATAVPGVAFGRAYFKVDTRLLAREFAAYAPRPPAAFDDRLFAAALAHCRGLIARDAEDHAGQLDRVRASGFRWTAFRGNVLSFARDVEGAHAALAIDWGPDLPDDGDGMQAGRGHRAAVLSLDGDYANAGIAALSEDDPTTGVGPLVVTENFCAADPAVPEHHNRFIVGTVWRDLDADGRYEAGEGVGGVRVQPAAGRYYAVTGDAGGFAVPITSPGVYRVGFSGGTDGPSATRTVAVGASSVLLDLEVGEAAREDGVRGSRAPDAPAAAP